MADATVTERPTPCPFLYVRDAEALVGVCKATLLNWGGEGTFPRPRRIGGRLAWLRGDVEDWLARQTAAAPAGRNP